VSPSTELSGHIADVTGASSGRFAEQRGPSAADYWGPR